MKRLLPLTLLLLAPLPAQDADPTPAAPTLADLAWLEGHWSSEQGGLASEEWWTAARGGLMLGAHRDVRVEGDELAGFEYLRIISDEQGVHYLASPGGRAPATPFTLVRVEGQEAVFENPDHDFPQRVVYRRDGDVLTARAEDLAGRKGLQFRWERR